MQRGVMRFGSLAYFRGIEDDGVRGDPDLPLIFSSILI
jgi:hypothetical protein